MKSDNKLEQMENEVQPAPEQDEVQMVERRRFLRGLGKWSMAVIGGVALGAAAPSEGAAWINRRGHGGGWLNRRGGGGWHNRGGSWANAAHGGGWLNRRGGGGWFNRR